MNRGWLWLVVCLSLSSSVASPGPAEDPQIDIDRAVLLAASGPSGFHRFDGFHLELEGIKLAAGRGSLVSIARGEKLERLTLHATDLSWAYAPPEQRDRQLFEIHRKDHREDLSFEPSYAQIECDPISCEQILRMAFNGLGDSTQDAVDERLRKLYQEGAKEAERALRQEGVEPAPAFWDADHRRVSVLVWRENPDHVALLEYDSHQPREVTVWISGMLSISYYAQLTRASHQPTEVLELRPDLARREYDVESLSGTISMGLGESELLAGDLTFILQARSELRRIPFTLASTGRTWTSRRRARGPRMSVGAVADGAGRALEYVRTGPVSGLVNLQEPVPAGKPVSLRIQYEARDAIEKVSGSYAYVDRDGWLPFVQYGDIIPRFELTLRVPAKYQTYCVGRRVSARREGDVATTRWLADSPVTFPTVIFGVFKEYESKVKAVKKDGKAIPVSVHFDRDTAALMPSLRGAPAAADEAANALNLYRDIFGVDYPFEKLDIVNAPQGFSGQSPDSIVYLGDPSFLSEATLGLSLGAAATKFVSGLVPHEVAHQWWGSLIAPANAGSYWFVESLAEYSAALFMEASRGKGGYLSRVEDWRRQALQTEVWGSVQDGEGIYTRGAYAFHILRSTFGDEAFFRFLKMLAGELQGMEIVTRDIQRVADEAFGTDVGWFFDQWIRGVGIPEFTFSYRVDKAEDGSIILRGRIDQRVMVTTVAPAREVLPDIFFRGVGSITMTSTSGKEYKRRLFLGPTVSFEEKLPEEPKEIRFNKYGEILAYDVIVKEEK